TGGDDLRGGSDNVIALVRVARAPDWITIPIHGGLNRGARWGDGTNHIIVVPIGGGGRCPTSPSLILAIRLQTTFGGGMGGDNWNLQSVHVDWIGTDAGGAPATGVLAKA